MTLPSFPGHRRSPWVGAFLVLLLLVPACDEDPKVYEPEGDGIYLAISLGGIVANGTGQRLPQVLVQFDAGFLRPEGVRYVRIASGQTDSRGEFNFIASETGFAKAGFWWLLPPDDVPPDRFGDITVYLRLRVVHALVGETTVEWVVYRKKRATVPVDAETYRMRQNATL
jgi:hypothetical protein